MDAMLCFRRAVKVLPRAAEPRLRLGEALQQLGLVGEAIRVWRDAAVLAPSSIDPLLPLAEALLTAGDFPGARDATARALALAPASTRASLLHAIARLQPADATDRDPQADAIATALRLAPALLAIGTVALPLALALDAAPAAPRRDAVLRQLACMPESLVKAPALLLALALEHAANSALGEIAAALFTYAGAREYVASEHDVLRRIALVATATNAEAAARLRERYVALCSGAFAAPVPLPWPRRTAGTRLRVVGLVGVAEDGVVADAVAALAAMPRAAFDVTLAFLGQAELPAWLGVAGVPCVGLAPAADGAARRLAALDPDVLVDLAGIKAAAGPLLAQRPARSIVTLGALVAAIPAPLTDRCLPTTEGLVAVLRQMQTDLPPTPEGVPDAAGMAAAWDEAVRAHQRGDVAAAREAYGRVLALQPGFAKAHYLRGILYRDDRNTRAARADFAAALECAPRYVEARVAAASTALGDREPQVASALCANGGGAKPQPAALLRAWGLAELALRHGATAAELFARALVQEPTDGDTHYNQGVALQMQRKHAEAARAYQRALAFKPDLIAADFNLGVLFQEQGATDPAIAAYHTVLAQDPKHVAAYRNVGETLLTAGRVDAALANFRRFEANCPDALGLAAQALEVLQHHGDFAGIDRYLDGLRLDRYGAADDLELCDILEQLLFLLLYFDVEPAVVFRYAVINDRALRGLHGLPLARPAVRRPGRIRIGYLSADLRGHVMGKMIWQEVQHHDRARFTLHFYSLASDRDEWTRRFEGIAETFVVLADASEREAAMRIAEDDLDLLIDCSTHTQGARPGILALKPARVQITHVASAGAVGLSTIDFKLTDHYADVAESGAYQLETLLPMAGCVYPFRHVAAVPQHVFRRDALGIAADAILIGAFFTALKLSRRCLALWREVLDRVPRARLVFSPANPAFRDSYVRLAAAGGIAPERLHFVPQGRSDAENRARYALIDLVLDPMPYGGVNGTLEALDMGVPVVTLVGTRHSERSSYSILANLGVLQTVARSAPEYVDIAVHLASEPSFMREVRAAIGAGLAGSALTDNAGRTRNLEIAYCQALSLRAPEVPFAARSPG